MQVNQVRSQAAQVRTFLCGFDAKIHLHGPVAQAEIILQGRFLKQVDRARSMAKLLRIDMEDEHQRWWDGNRSHAGRDATYPKHV